MKGKRNSDEVQHVDKPCDTSLYFLPLNESEMVHPCSPPTHEVEETTSINDEEFRDPVEVALAPALPTHEDKEMVICSHTDDLMKETLDMVDNHIDTFILTRRRTWDFSSFHLL
jgi:hypothetical protein